MPKITSIKKTYTNKLHVGYFTGIVKYIDYSDDFVDDDAICVKYALFDDNGNEYSHSEIFFNRAENPRTAEFFKHLNSLGIDNDDFSPYRGAKEKIRLQKKIDDSSNKSRLTITEREFIEWTDGRE